MERFVGIRTLHIWQGAYASRLTPINATQRPREVRLAVDGVHDGSAWA